MLEIVTGVYTKKMSVRLKRVVFYFTDKKNFEMHVSSLIIEFFFPLIGAVT
jgi:hypothetical protein